MHGDEEDLEAAGEEAKHEQPVAAVAECLGQRLRQGLLRRRGRSSPCAGVPRRREGERQRHDQKHDRGKNHERALPAITVVSATASGENRNCPNDPAAVPAPKASARHCGGISLPNAPITTVKEEPASPKPIMTPALRWSIAGVLA